MGLGAQQSVQCRTWRQSKGLQKSLWLVALRRKFCVWLEAPALSRGRYPLSSQGKPLYILV